MDRSDRVFESTARIERACAHIMLVDQVLVLLCIDGPMAFPDADFQVLEDGRAGADL
jgi:hypothetical protein